MKKKKIAVDCSKLESSYLTGTHRFLVGFLNELTKNKEIEFYFYTKSNNHNLEKFAFTKNGTVICLNTSILYTQLGLLKELNKYDYFIFPWQTVPFLGFIGTTKKMAIIHDQGYSLRSKITTFLTLLIADKVFSVSESTAKKIFRKSVVVGEGVDSDLFYPVSANILKDRVLELGVPNFFILSLGRIEKRKNIYNNLRAFAKVKKFYPNLKYVFIGNFIDSEEEIYSFIDRLNLQRSDFLFKQGVSDSDLNIYLNSMEFLVFTSFEEGFGLPVLEAYSVNKPVILSRIEQLAEFELSANQYVDPLNVDQIAEKMIFFLRKQYDYSKKDYKAVLSKFSWKNSSDTFMKNLQ